MDNQSTSEIKPSQQDIEELIRLYNSGQIPQAESRARELLEKHRGFAILHNILGSSLYAQGKFAEAVSSYQQALQIDPNQSMVQCNLGLALICLGKPGLAVDSLRHALKVDSKNALAYSNLGMALTLLGNKLEALTCLQEAVKLAPNNAEVHGNLGNALINIGMADESVHSYQQALKINPNIARLHNNLGSAFARLGRLNEAIGCFNQAINLKPEAETYYNLHPLLLDSNDISPAIRCMEAAVQLQPLKTEYKFFLGMLLEYAGRTEAAIPYIEEVQQGSELDRARLDAWNYIKSSGAKMPKMTGSPIEAFRLGMNAAVQTGLVLEFGVNFGASIRQIARLANQEVHGFDSFEGLPESWHDQTKGAYSTNGIIPDVPDNVFLYKGWFDATLPEFLKVHKDPVRFMNVDCDIYSSTKTILDCLSSQIVAGTVIVFDEYIGNSRWREDEFKAFQESVKAFGWKYEYLAFSMFTKQVVVRIL